jgi:hypothetical protein
MSTKKQKERKQKERKEKAKKKILARRKKLRDQFGQDKKTARLDKKFRTKMQPLIKDKEKREIMEKNNNEKLISKLEKNAELLKFLESEYEKELENKKNINKALESEGYLTLEEKMSALEQKVKDNMSDSEIDQGKIEMSNSDKI